jgi:lipopolysaccharide transport system ATP-binding protein
MADPIITVEGVGKRYTLRHQARGYTTLRDELQSRFRSLGRPRGLGSAAEHDTVEDFWALRDVNFAVERGDVVGIIGRNGAGKSTLLKILSRITEPTTGRIMLGGRVASLLEVGTGFHPELSGRENIFLNGAILGMTKAEIRGKFDEIVAFAEVDRFLDTPVKHYSSGMYVRLAFAVAAHLEPEILVVDEVLAVGDAQFQQKCIGKMKDVAARERTVLFVSHTMSAVRHLCNRVVVMAEGRVRFTGTVNDGIQDYLASLRAAGPRPAPAYRASSGAPVSLDAVTLERHGECCQAFLFDDAMDVLATIHVSKPSRVGIECVLRDDRHNPVAFAPSSQTQEDLPLEPGRHVIRCRLAPLRIASGGYSLDILLVESGKTLINEYPAAASFTLEGAVVGSQRWHFTQNLNRGSVLWGVSCSLSQQNSGGCRDDG